MGKPYSTWTEAQKESHRACVRRWRAENPEKFAFSQQSREQRPYSKFSGEEKARHLGATKRWRAKMLATGCCTACGKPRDGASAKWCANCLIHTNERNRAQNRALKLEVFAAYGGAQCACPGCSEKRDEFLTMDHIEGWRKHHEKRLGGVALYRWLKQNGFPEGFRVLCMNCNFALGHFGYCPHELERRATPDVESRRTESAPLLNTQFLERRFAYVN